MNREILKKINSEYPEKQIPFLHKMNRNWGQTKPLKGIKILHNLLNSYETLHKLEALIHAEGRFEYTITAGSTTINLGNGNQITDSFASIGQIVFADQKAYLPVIGVSPKGKRPSLKMFNF